jgi:hypothetical protein
MIFLRLGFLRAGYRVIRAEGRASSHSIACITGVQNGSSFEHSRSSQIEISFKRDAVLSFHLEPRKAGSNGRP